MRISSRTIGSVKTIASRLEVSDRKVALLSQHGTLSAIGRRFDQQLSLTMDLSHFLLEAGRTETTLHFDRGAHLPRVRAQQDFGIVLKEPVAGSQLVGDLESAGASRHWLCNALKEIVDFFLLIERLLFRQDRVDLFRSVLGGLSVELGGPLQPGGGHIDEFGLAFHELTDQPVAWSVAARSIHGWTVTTQAIRHPLEFGETAFCRTDVLARGTLFLQLSDRGLGLLDLRVVSVPEEADFVGLVAQVIEVTTGTTRRLLDMRRRAVEAEVLVGVDPGIADATAKRLER